MKKPLRCLGMPYQHMSPNLQLSVRMAAVPIINPVQNLFCSGKVHLGNLYHCSVKFCLFQCRTFGIVVTENGIRLQFISKCYCIKMSCHDFKHFRIINFGACYRTSDPLSQSLVIIVTQYRNHLFGLFVIHDVLLFIRFFGSLFTGCFFTSCFLFDSSFRYFCRSRIYFFRVCAPAATYQQCTKHTI